MSGYTAKIGCTANDLHTGDVDVKHVWLLTVSISILPADEGGLHN